MNNITYEVIEEKYSLSGKNYISYGIAALSKVEDDETVCVVASVRNITADRLKLSELADICNRLQLSPIHLNSVIEDFLTQKS